MKLRNYKICACAFALVAFSASQANAALYSINWMNMAPTPYGSSVPNNSVFNLPGVGNVTMTYSIPTTFSDARVANPFLTAGNVVNGPDTYSWTNEELFGTTNLASSSPLVGVPWQITYTFPGTVPAGTLALGIAGLGQTTSFGGGASTATVFQNGTFLGDWTGGGNYGATQYSAGNPFQMQNSVTGAGGADPWWNTAFGVVRIDDAVNSLTVDFRQISGDGVGVNIGYIIPEPATAMLLGITGVLTLVRRRR